MFTVSRFDADASTTPAPLPLKLPIKTPAPEPSPSTSAQPPSDTSSTSRKRKHAESKTPKEPTIKMPSNARRIILLDDGMAVITNKQAKKMKAAAAAAAEKDEKSSEIDAETARQQRQAEKLRIKAERRGRAIVQSETGVQLLPTSITAQLPVHKGQKKKSEEEREKERAERRAAREQAQREADEKLAKENPEEWARVQQQRKEQEEAKQKAKEERMKMGQITTTTTTTAAPANASTSTNKTAKAEPSAPKIVTEGLTPTSTSTTSASTSTSTAPSTSTTPVHHSARPLWMRNAHIIHTSKRDDDDGDDIKGVSCNDYALDQRIIEALQKQGITTFFPTQSEVIPMILRAHGHNDVCVSAPTGSGKTLSYVIPIIQHLSTRVIRRIRALVLLPTRELALQVYDVFQSICPSLGLSVATALGQQSFTSEQRSLISPDHTSLIDILVCTPGRLMDHLTSTPGFTLEYVEFLVIDEADRLLTQHYHDWIERILAGVYGGKQGTFTITSDGNPHLNETCIRQQYVGMKYEMAVPFQKLLLSATLTNNPQKLAALQLKNPVFFTESSSHIRQYKIPTTLSAYLTVCSEGDKPLILLYLLHTLQHKQIMIFTGSIASTHRLHRLLQCYNSFSTAEFSSSLPQHVRSDIIHRFRSGQIRIIVSSDAMARGIDVENVEAVINYDVPIYIKTYVHRVGRTARAGKHGCAYTLIRQKEIPHFYEMLRGAENTRVEMHVIKRSSCTPCVPQYTQALERLKTVLALEKDPISRLLSQHGDGNGDGDVEMKVKKEDDSSSSSSSDSDSDSDSEDEKPKPKAEAKITTLNGSGTQKKTPVSDSSDSDSSDSDSDSDEPPAKKPAPPIKPVVTKKTASSSSSDDSNSSSDSD